ncbi:nitrate reductase subunit gamma [Myxococcus stipitatus DSM 14675]|uniref:Nitrate reductase subunit gamma n=1 Tax=Myxococcus stipitatus (strain DSM 14675 / JCM 12634 / Mx s8) TaxID=1278073 RepID=L7UIN7_MYXSD|nr:respiratory nitrate reductase subunit gamma [Myxococcus stipitatus]AGC47407.1 nitrate reductase subunit gamma [Myxococcus stipitatus DSM 14675]
MSDSILFNVIPYAAALVTLAGGIARLTAKEPAAPPSPWTPAGRTVLAGASIVLFLHLVGLAAPRAMQVFNASPARLFTLESLGLIGALLLSWGLLTLGLRRAREGQWGAAVAFALVLSQVLTGVYVAVALRWASAWYLHVTVPYLRSLMSFQPDATLLQAAPLVIQVHVLASIALLGAAPFLRFGRVPARTPASVEPGLLATPREETP